MVANPGTTVYRLNIPATALGALRARRTNHPRARSTGCHCASGTPEVSATSCRRSRLASTPRCLYPTASGTARTRSPPTWSSPATRNDAHVRAVALAATDEPARVRTADRRNATLAIPARAPSAWAVTEAGQTTSTRRRPEDSPPERRTSQPRPSTGPSSLQSARCRSTTGSSGETLAGRKRVRSDALALTCSCDEFIMVAWD